MGEVSGTNLPSYLARREVLELCNYLMIAAGLAVEPAPAVGDKRRTKAKKQPRPLNLTAATRAFDEFVSGKRKSWHPLGDKIPRFSPSHCSTGTVLLVQALLLCRKTRLYGFHACSCKEKCAGENIAARNHYWDKKETARFDEMFS
eukprot:1402895-Prymnesium_polylepis.1